MYNTINIIKYLEKHMRDHRKYLPKGQKDKGYVCYDELLKSDFFFWLAVQITYLNVAHLLTEAPEVTCMTSWTLMMSRTELWLPK